MIGKNACIEDQRTLQKNENNEALYLFQYSVDVSSKPAARTLRFFLEVFYLPETRLLQASD